MALRHQREAAEAGAFRRARRALALDRARGQRAVGPRTVRRRRRGLYAVGVALDWNFLAGGGDLARVDAAVAASAGARARLEARERQARLEIGTRDAQLATASGRAATAVGAASLANEAKRVIERRYEQGLATWTELVSAESAHSNARLGELTARYEVWLAWARRERGAGPSSGFAGPGRDHRGGRAQGGTVSKPSVKRGPSPKAWATIGAGVALALMFAWLQGAFSGHRVGPEDTPAASAPRVPPGSRTATVMALESALTEYGAGDGPVAGGGGPVASYPGRGARGAREAGRRGSRRPRSWSGSTRGTWRRSSARRRPRSPPPRRLPTKRDASVSAWSSSSARRPRHRSSSSRRARRRAQPWPSPTALGARSTRRGCSAPSELGRTVSTAW